MINQFVIAHFRINYVRSELIWTSEHGQELVFVDDGDSERTGFLELGRSHIVAGENVVGLLGDGSGILASVELNHLLVLLTAMTGEHA